MALGSNGDHQNDAASTQPLTGETTATKRQRLIISIGTLASPSPSPSFSFSSDPPGDSLHAPPPPPPPTLPFELVVEILSRLPVKFLLQLRGVCKSWNSLISDPKFAKKHLRGSRTHFSRHHLSLCCRNSSPEFLFQSSPLPSVFNAVPTSIPPMQLRYTLNNRCCLDKIVGSCNGILCFATVSSVLVWNPSIRRFKTLPPLENTQPVGGGGGGDTYTIYGFGCDFTDNYKVVAIFCYECDSGYGVYKTRVKVHTLGTDSWRSIPEFPCGTLFSESGEFVNGTVNWLPFTALHSSQVIVSFDLGKESYQEFLQPDYGGVDVFPSTLGVLRDCLCILSHGDTFSDVWVMKDYGNKESWTKLFTIPYTGDLAYNYNPYAIAKALYISEDDQMLLECEFESQSNHLVMYNFRNGTSKIPNIQNISDCMFPKVYVESLISPCP